MKTQTQMDPCFGMAGCSGSGLVKRYLIASLALLWAVSTASAGTVMLRVTDALGTSSITGSTNWNPTGVPTAGNIYVTTNAAGVGVTVRTPTGLANNVFAGDALMLFTNLTGATLLIKGDQGSSITINNLILAGGSVGNGASAANVATTNTVAGNINVVAPSRFDTGGAGRAILVAAAITNGTSSITCTNPGSIWMFGTNYGFTGRMVAMGGCTLRITNQFNLGGNPATFVADQLLLDNGILSVTNSVTLNDANRGITLSTNGGKFDVTVDAVLTLPNPITGRTLTKTGAGVLVLSGANTYTNGTVLSGGTLSVQNSLGLGTTGTVNQASGARNATIQLQGDISLPSTVNFTTSNDGTGSTFTNAIENISGNNTINGTISQTTGGGGTAIQSDSGALVLAGNVTIAAGQSSRGITLQGASTGANTISGNITDLSATSINAVAKIGPGNWTLTGTNTYSGVTAISNGVLALSGWGTIAKTPLITVASGATFDVSGLAATFTLGAGQSISNSTGMVIGPVATAAGASIYPATMGTPGALTFNGNLNLSAGGAAYLDVSSVYNGGNDQIVVGGNLALSSSDTIHLNALEGGTPLDQTADYILFSVTGTTTMATTPNLVWDGAQPANTANFSLKLAGHNVVLAYSAATAPSVANATANPNPAYRNQAVTVTAYVTKGSGTVTGVTVDLSPVGGSATAALVLDEPSSSSPNFVYTNTFTVSAGATLGNKSLTVVAADNTSPTPLTGNYIITPFTVAANAVTWSGGGTDGKWSTKANWLSDLGPGYIGDSVAFGTGSQPVTDLDANYGITSLVFNDGADAFTIGSSTGSVLTNSGGIINYSVNNQTLNVPLVISAAQTFIAGLGNLTFNGNLTLGGNTLTLDGSANTAIGGVVSGTAGLTKMGTGTLTLPGANTFSGSMNLAGGTLVVGHDQAAGTGLLNFNGAGTEVTIQSLDGTAHTLTNALNFGGSAIFSGTGNLKFTSTPTPNGTAKTLTVNNPVTEFSGVLGGASARTVGGTGILILSGANTYSKGTTINPGATLQLGTGGTNGSLSTSGTIDIEGTLIFNRSDALVQGTHFSAPIVGAGAVVQAGAGTVTLNAANSYTGLTTVNNGELFISPGYQAGGAVVVANNAKFGVAASSVTNSAIIGNLTLGSGGATLLDFAYGLSGNPTNVALVAGAVAINGTCTVRISGNFAVGAFPILQYGSLSGAFVGTVVAPRGVAATLSNDVVNQVLYVKVASLGSGIVWTGTNSVLPNLWDLNTTANWLIGGSATSYLETVPPGDAVTFNDLGSGLVLVSNTVSPANFTLNNPTVSYTFQGPGQINSVGGLTKVGVAMVTLNVPGNFAGSTVVSNGTLSLGANQTFGSLSGNGAVTVGAGAPTVTVNQSSNTVFAGGISGVSALTKAGLAGLTLTGSNNVAGNLFVDTGSLTLDSGIVTAGSYCSIGHVGTGSGDLTLKGAASLVGNNDFNVGDIGASAGTVNVQDTATLTVSSLYVGSANAAGSTASGTVNQTGGTVTQLNTGTGTFAIGGRVEATSIGATGVYNLLGGVLNATSAIRVGGGGTGTFNQSGGLVNAGVDVNLARFAGSVGTYNLDGGTLRTARVTSSTGASATLNLNGGVLLAREDNTSIITNLTMVNVRDGGAVVDTTNLNVTISSSLQHSVLGGDNAIDGGLTKRGTGTLTLVGGVASYTGPTLVLAGTLNLASGSVNSLNSLVVSNAALGLTMNYGSGSFNAASLKLAGNAVLNINYDLVLGSPATALVLSGGITAPGTTVINVNGYGFTVGQFPLVSYVGTPLPNLNNISLGILPVGVTASLLNNTANSSIDLVITAVDTANWIPLANNDAFGKSSFNSGNSWLDTGAPTAGNGYFTRTYLLRSPADANPYTFGGNALSIDAGGHFLLKGTGGQVLTIPNLVLNGGGIEYAVSTGDNLIETLAGNITLQPNTASYVGSSGSAATAETLTVDSAITGSGQLQIGSPSVNNGQDVGVVVLAGTSTHTGSTTIGLGTVLVNGTVSSSPVTVTANATLGGTGTLGGPVVVGTGATLAPGTPTRGAWTAALGTLTAGNTTINGTVLMKIDRSATPNSDRLVSSSVVINPGATLTVNNLGSTNLAAGDTFTLFSTPVNGTFGTVNLPPLPDATLAWTNRLALNGTIAVMTTTTINTNSPVLGNSVANGVLTLTWPTDHTGWTLQVQTNSLATGLGANWVDVPGSTATNSMDLPVVSTNGAVFYRLKL